jgi:hypothetical protein
MNPTGAMNMATETLRLFDDSDTPTTDRIVSANGVIDPAKPERLRELERWLRSNFESTLEDAVRKADQYGSDDIGIMAAALTPVLPHGPLSSKQAVIAFYAMGKLSRILGAIQDGQEPTQDSWQDLRVYATMGEKVRATGVWL